MTNQRSSRRNGAVVTTVPPATVTLTAEEYNQLKALADKGASRSILTCKVGSKGNVSVYGLQRMPVSLYVEQWERLIDFSPEIAKFLTANAGLLDRSTDDDNVFALKLAARDAAGIPRPEVAKAAFEAKQAAAAGK